MMNHSCVFAISKDISYPLIKAQLFMEIEFGTPSKGCRNYGICNMTPLNPSCKIISLTGKKSWAIVTVHDHTHIEITFLRRSLNIRTYQRLFSGDSFLVEEDYHYKSHNTEGDYFSIFKGNYLILRYNDFINVVFKAPGTETTSS